MNTGALNGTKIGGGQLARRKLFSNKNYFSVIVLTSECQIAELWNGLATVIHRPELKIFRPCR